jgi:hypothetical protein
LCFLFLIFWDDIAKDWKKSSQTIYTSFEYLTFTAFFYLNIKNKKVRTFILLASFSFIVFQVFYLLAGKVRRLDTIPIGIETILLFSYIVYFLYQLSKDEQGYLYNHYCFWLSIGILIYLGGSFFFYMLINHLNKDEIITFGDMTYVAEIIKNVLFATALFVYSKFHKKEYPTARKNIPYLDLI